MDIFQVMTVIFGGTTVLLAIDRWRHTRPHLKVHWDRLRTDYERYEEMLAMLGGNQAADAPPLVWFSAAITVAITNPSPQPDSVDGGIFEMRQPHRLRISGRRLSPPSEFRVTSVEEDSSLPVGETRRFRCKLLLLQPETWVDKRVAGTVKVRTTHRTISCRISFTVPAVPPSSTMTATYSSPSFPTADL